MLASLLGRNRSWTDLSPAEIAVLRGLPQIHALLRIGPDLRQNDPEARLAFAKLARCAADRLSARELGSQPVVDLRALAWAELGNAYRVCNDLNRAAYAMNRAVYWCSRGSRSHLLLARVADLLASLLGYQRRFSESRELLQLAYDSYVADGDWHRAGRTLISQGNLAVWEGRTDESIPLMRRGFDLLDPDREPDLVVHTLWNMVATLADLGRFRSARRLLWRSRIIYEGVVDPHRIRWQEAKIHVGLAEHAKAELAFRQARTGLVATGQTYRAALAGLDLAALLASQGRNEEVYRLAGEMITTFRALRIGREAIATLLVLKQACLTGGQIQQVIAMAVDLLRDLERQPAHSPTLRARAGGGASGHEPDWPEQTEEGPESDHRDRKR
jgi:tetratricopeptide (TPR) repeat protein